TYKVFIQNNLGSTTSTDAKLSVFAAAAPTISAQPAPQSVFVGQTATFSVIASGSPTLKYQWEKNHQPIAGATFATYTTPVLSSANNGDVYTVVVTNPVNPAATSTDALLTVNAAVPITITQQPSNVLALPGQSASFSVTVAGSTPIQYVWQK